MRCKIFYQRDYLNLLIKYGLEEPSQKNLLSDGSDDAEEAETGLIFSGEPTA